MRFDEGVDMSEPTIQDLFDLTGKTAFITGGAGYLGSAMSRALAEAGATVVVGSRDRDRAQEAAEGLPKSDGVTHCGVQLDHMDGEALEIGFSEALDLAGKIDILVNNGHEPVTRDWTDITHEQFARQLGNAAGYFTLARCVRNHAVERGQPSSIVMIGSMYGQVASYPDAYEDIASPAAYQTLKSGIIHLTRHLAVYWAADRVRVNCLSPGPFPNPKTVADGLVDRLCEKSPMKRMGVSWELKGAIVFLASDASGYMTGQNLTVDGGWTAW